MQDTITQLAPALSAWQALLGPDNVLQGDAAQQAWGLPAALRILDSKLLPEVMRIAQRCRVPVHPISTGHNWGYGSALAARDGCVIIDLSQLHRHCAGEAARRGR